ncbi:MAG TPA: hypothetical protein DIT25_03795 [Candidatus Moranbacteria bacterium]|nr:hypothetical protein [Candidatus Moranbacteria bacterium]
MFYRIKFLAYKLAIGSAIRRAKKIIAVSDFTRKDILGRYGVKKDKIALTYESCDDFCNIPAQNEIDTHEKYGLADARRGIIKRYLLYVGNSYPHKNLEKLILAFSDIRKNNEDLFLVLVGKHDFFYNRLIRLAEEEKIKNIIFPGYIPDQDLDVIYKKTELYVFPSLYEGFGIPPLEAMAKGVPVAASDHECLREVLEDSAYFFDARSSDKIASAVRVLLDDADMRQSLIGKGYEQIKKYSWRKMAEETLDIYKSAVETKTNIG